MTATRNGAEQYATLFGGYFIDALVSDTADGDKNKRVSVLEAFQFAKAEVTKAYEREGLLATEHALLDDNGDKDGSQDPSATGKDGKVANIVSLGAASAEGLPADPKVRALYLERRELERRVEALRLLKESMEPGRYIVGTREAGDRDRAEDARDPRRRRTLNGQHRTSAHRPTYPGAHCR